MPMLYHSCCLAACITVLACPETSAQVKEESLPIAAVPAFPKLRIRRPVVFTHAGDGSNRIFMCTQQGVIHVLPNNEQVAEPTTFLDIEKRVAYKDSENEEGLLGLAFHPQFKENGYFFIFYNTTSSPHTCVVSRVRVSPNDKNVANPESEEELLRLTKPFWNHNGGTLAFGPDGMLYIGLGDGGSLKDPLGHGQNLNTWFGSILRIDVNRQDPGKKYAVPKDNPFVGREMAQPEIWAYGLRNVWRLSFDRKTGLLWAADVGQDLWEEINIIVKGGNYGWSIREGKHPFGEKGVAARPDLVDPVWEYHHDLGKSITGGHVYRGTKVPQLAGCYLYGDYVSGKLWALKYDERERRVLANYSLVDSKAPVITFGEDEAGEVYFTDAFGLIYKFSAVK